MYFRPGTHREAGLSFSPIKAIISPRPIGWISSRGDDGSINLAPTVISMRSLSTHQW